MNKQWQRRLLIWLGLLVAFGLRVYTLGDQNIWWDEGLSVLAARKSFTGATLWTAADVHPPLYFWILLSWQCLAGETEFALRYITVLEALLTVAAMVPLGRRLGKAGVGAGALWLLGLSRYHIWWSQEMRMYVLAGLCITASLYFVYRLGRGERRWIWLGWGLATWGALMTIYASIVLILIQNLFMLVVGWRRDDRWHFWGRWTLGQLSVGALVVPWLLLALPRMRSWSVVQKPASLPFVLELNAVLLTLGISTNVGQYVIPALSVVGVLLIGLILVLRRRAGAWCGVTLLLLGTLLPSLVVWLLTQPRGFFYTPQVEARYLLPYAPAFYALLAWALVGWLRSRRIWRWTGLALCAVFLVGMGWTLPQHYASRYFQDSYSSLVRIIWAYGRPDDVVVLVSADRYPLFLTYYDRRPAPVGRPPVYRMPEGIPTVTPGHLDDVLGDMITTNRRIWLVQVERALQDPEALTEAWLAERYARPLSYDFAHNNLSLFAPTETQPTVPPGNVRPQHALEATPLPGLELLGYDLPTDEFRAGDTIRLGLYLRASQPVTVPVALQGADGRTVARQAVALTARDGVVRRQVAFEVTPYTPPQRYHFVVTPGDESLLTLGELRVTRTHRAPDVAKIPHPLEARLGDDVRLLGYRLKGVKKGTPPQVSPGDVLRLTLYWQAEASLSKNYHVFTHLIGTAHNPATGGPLWGQDDQVPLEGAYPTYTWLPGLPLADHYEIQIDPQAPPGDYQLAVGMYTPGDVGRVPVSGEGAVTDQRYVLLTLVRVAP